VHYSFDFDYTLADSSGGTIECATYALSALGFPAVGEEKIRGTIGLSLERTFYSLTNSKDDPAAAADFKRLFLEKADVAMLDHIVFFESAPVVLSKLKEEGHFVSIVSTKYRTRLTQALDRDGLAHLVDYIVGGDDVSQSKPHPEGLLMAVSASHISPNDTIYVGDSVSDGECAKRAGVRFIAVATGLTKRTRLEKWSPELILPNLSHLLDHVPAGGGH